MPKYIVYGYTKVHYSQVVEAETQEDAEELAFEIGNWKFEDESPMEMCSSEEVED